MRDIIIFTKEPISVEQCKHLLLGNIKHCVENGASGICFEKPSTLYFNVENDLLSQALECDFSAEERAMLLSVFQADDVFLNVIQYHRPIDAKKLLESLLTIYPDMRLFVDNVSEDEINGYCTAADYLTQFDHKKPQ